LIFYDLTIDSTGDRFSKRAKDSATLSPAAVRVMRGLIGANGGEIPLDGLRHIRLQWTTDPARPGTALATFLSRKHPLTTSVLLTDSTSVDDARYAAKIVQGLLQKILRSLPGIEPGFDLLAVTERPVIATLVLPGLPHPDLPMVADMETCLAAAYFLTKD
jgi:hypothetical protein